MVRRLWRMPPALVWILAVALVTRVVAAFILGNEVSGLSGAHDEISYSVLGERFATGYGMTFPNDWYPWIAADSPQSYYSFSMSFYLAAIYWMFGYYPLIARLIMAVLSVLIVGMIYLVAQRLFTERIAIVASAIAAVYAYLIFYGVTLVTETPFMVALLIALYICLVIRDQQPTGLWPWVALSTALAVGVLFRMAVILFVPVLLVWLVLQIQEKRLRYRVLIPVVVIGLAVLPFTIRNFLLWGQFSLLETQFGHVFWNGNHPGHNGDFRPYVVFPIPAEVLASRNDVTITNQLLRMGLENVRNDPMNFLQLVVTRLRELFTFWPTDDSTWLANVLRVGSFGLIFPLSMIGLILNLARLRELAPIYIFIVMHVGVYALTWTMIRYRMPIEPFFIMFAAFAAVRLVQRAMRGRTQDAADPQAEFASVPAELNSPASMEGV